MEEAGEQGFGIEFEQFGRFDRAGHVADPIPTVRIVIVGLRHLLQEEAGCCIGAGGDEQA